MIPSVMFSRFCSVVIARKGEYLWGKPQDCKSLLPRYYRTKQWHIRMGEHKTLWCEVVLRDQNILTKNAKPDNEVEICQTNQFKNNFVLRLYFHLGVHSKVTIPLINKLFVSLVLFKNNAANKISILRILQRQLL